MIGAFIAIGVIGAIFIFVNPFFGLILVTAMLPQALLQAATDRFIGFISMGTPIKLIGAITFVAVFTRVLGEKERFAFLKSNIFKLYIAFLLFIYISGFTQTGAYTRSNFTVFTSMAVFGFIVLALVNTIRRFRIILWTALIAALISSLGAIMGLMYSAVDRMSGAYYGPNEFAILLLPMIAVSFYASFSTKHKGVRILLILIALALTLALISTVSRGGIVGLGAMLVIAFLRAKRKLMALLFLAISLMVFMNYMPQSMRDRFSKTKVEDSYTGEGTIDSTTRRYNLALAAWRMFLQKPIAGFGIGNYYYICSQYAPVVPGRAHNMYLEIMAEMGIIGTVLFLTMIFLTLKTISRIIKTKVFPASGYASGLYVGLMGFCVAAIFLHAEQEKILWFIVFMTATLERITFQPKQKEVKK